MASESAPQYNIDDYKQITEGQATILFPKHNEVFYNPVQKFNRDMSIAAIKTWRDMTMEARLQRYERSQRPEKQRPATTFTVLEALAASGLRSVRYAKEIEDIEYIVANDLLGDAVESIRRNVHYNGLSQRLVRANEGDAMAVMYGRRGDKFDVIDLDPYGTAAPFVDGAVQAVKNGGLLCVTCTDLAVLASNNHPSTCFYKYGGSPLKAEFCHELALRLVVHSLQQAANKHKLFVEPLLSCSIDFYVRLFVRVHERPVLVKGVASQTGLVFHCRGCGGFATQALGTVEEGKGGSKKYLVAAGPSVDRLCDACGGRQEIGGPCWLGPLHNRDFVRRMYDGVSRSATLYGTQARMKGMLKVVLEELDTPLHYTLAQLFSAVRAACPTLVRVNSALLNAGYRVSGVHSCPAAIKTDAPAKVVWDVVRAHVREIGRSPRVAEGSSAYRILAGEVGTEVSFEPHEGADPESRRIKLVRYQINPEKNWGPKARHGTQRSAGGGDGGAKRKPGAEAAAVDAAAAGLEAVAVAEADAEADAKKPRTD
ncbi:RNA methyltransferase tRNA(m5U54)methyltransferase [Coemansia erecta]|uniref:tRNA (guanine(26)-N(2))-dimethyltransferase n=1 Tax=Coemansia erecta TaxID=147472 RepID=A0A9W8CPM7_9FUNG|nr:RNA methyltransferase tRNA(m5U54)methyltransferase [Coemansia erecta]